MKKILTNILLFLFCAIILALSLRGVPGNPTEQTLNTIELTEMGPLELSPERGRYALTFSIVENQSATFSIPVARFATPDLGLINNQYVSLFAPGVSFIVLPGYLIGRYFDLAQVGTYSVIALFAIANLFLIRAIAMTLGANKTAATIGGLLFLFATPAFAYAVNLYQHHISTFLLLSSIYLLLSRSNFWSLVGIWFLFATAIVVDNPNLFLLLPVALFAFFKFFFIKNEIRKISVTIRLSYIFTFIGVIVPLGFFFWFNNISYGSPFILAGNATQVKGIDEQGRPMSKDAIYKNLGLEYKAQVTKEKKDVVKYFKTRNLLNGFYTHFISPDRGILYFTPIVLFGIIGAIILYRIIPAASILFLTIIGLNVLLYSMWGDPYGGWAFGSRYLIPSYALLSLMIAFLLTKTRKKTFLLLLFLVVLGYSTLVNTLGALTSSRNPPQVEVIGIEKLTNKEEKYTYERNWDLLNTNFSKSFIWKTYGYKYFTAVEYYWMISTVILLIFIVLMVNLRLNKYEK